jgi:hypothetical protein
MLFGLTACQDDFLDTAPEDTISNVQLASNPAALQAIVNGMYANLRSYGIGGQDQHIDYGLTGVRAGLDMMSNDITQSVFHWYGFYYNYDARVQTSTRTEIIWNTYYTQVAEANSVINAIEMDTDDPTAKALLGQALALRALFTFNTARIYAHTYIGHENDLCIPLPNGNDFEGKPRSTVSDVYAQIRADIEAAIPLLEGFTRVTRQELDQLVAYGIAARVYLEMGEWSLAASAANSARQGRVPMGETEWMQGFSDINLSEVMWGADIDAESSSVYASFFSHFANLSAGYAGILGVYKNIDARLWAEIPETDFRFKAFAGDTGNSVLPPYANMKFKDATFFEGDYIYMRVSEMYLIEAEALARNNLHADAQALLFEFVSTRDASYTQSTATGDDLVNEIYLQRRIELWGEGFAFYDMKRMKRPLERDYEGTNHPAFGLFNHPAESDMFNFQLPEAEVNANDAISSAEQNP